MARALSAIRYGADDTHGKEERKKPAGGETDCAQPPKGRARWNAQAAAGRDGKLTEHKAFARDGSAALDDRKMTRQTLAQKDRWHPQVDGE